MLFCSICNFEPNLQNDTPNVINVNNGEHFYPEKLSNTLFHCHKTILFSYILTKKSFSENKNKLKFLFNFDYQPEAIAIF